ncbi:GntR family transcriptional regulator [Saccharospirillum sp. HFRX-1]|uniref:GntR family transcriptional regulator n=1 Tax=unclassified Saccharospirillum TaxID=2633430 RepID=UPI00371E4566
MSLSDNNINLPWSDKDLAPIRDKVYSYIKDAILRGEFKAGDRLVERNLADKLNISRTPIREALFRLESQKFVSTVPRKGVVVNEISRDEILEVFLILSSLESLAARLAAQKIDEQTRVEFDQAIAALAAIEQHPEQISDSGTHLDINLQYNDLIGKASKNIRLHEMLMELKDYVRAFTNLSSQTPGRAMEALKEHLNILIAVRDGQEGLAENYARVHVEKARNAYLKASVQAQADAAAAQQQHSA